MKRENLITTNLALPQCQRLGSACHIRRISPLVAIESMIKIIDRPAQATTVMASVVAAVAAVANAGGAGEDERARLPRFPIVCNRVGES